MMKKSKNSKKLVIIGGSFLAIVLMLVFAAVASQETTRLDYVGNQEMEAILADRSGQGTFVYIGSPSCPVCNDFRPTVEATLRQLRARMYYFETDAAIADDLERARANLLQTASSTPTIVYIVDGEVISSVHAVSQDALLTFLEQDLAGLNGR